MTFDIFDKRATFMVKVKVIIFDLDNCVFDTHSMSEGILDALLATLDQSDLTFHKRQKAKDLLWTTSLDDISSIVGFSGELLSKLHAIYANLEAPDGLKSYGDEFCVKKLPGRKILVSTGYQKFQEGKIAKLGLADLFDEIILDIIGDPTITRKGKRRIFEALMAKNKWAASEVVVVGDNPTSELGAGKALGLTTVQTLRPGVVKWPEADFHITRLTELEGIIKQIENNAPTA